MYHYQQVRISSKVHVDKYLWMSANPKMSHKYGKKDNEKHRQPHEDPYPWLPDDNPRRYQSDVEILFKKIDLKDSPFTRKEKAKLMKMLLKFGSR